jgi:hypothetical protein
MLVSVLRLCFAGLLLACLSACSTKAYYVAKETSEVPSSEFRATQPLRPVQLLYEFQSDGVPNARVTLRHKPEVLAQLAASGIFASVSESPTDGAALLTITLNNVVTGRGDAIAKGVVQGLTLGLVGSTVTDDYVCTARYSAEPGAPTLAKEAHHAIHSSSGLTGTPENATRVESLVDALKKMRTQIISTVLRELSNDPGFR